MRKAGLEPDASDMADGPVPDREVALKLAVAALVAAVVAAVVIWDPIVSLARSLDLPGSISVPDVPGLPKWLTFLLGKGKYILLAVIVAMAARRRPPSARP
jgi:hypothetical protein